jgi:hypothetical protein
MWEQFNSLTKVLTDQASHITEQATHAVRAAGLDGSLVSEAMAFVIQCLTILAQDSGLVDKSPAGRNPHGHGISSPDFDDYSQEQARHQLTDQISTLASSVLTVEPVSPEVVRTRPHGDAARGSERVPPYLDGSEPGFHGISLLDGQPVSQHKAW